LQIFHPTQILHFFRANLPFPYKNPPISNSPQNFLFPVPLKMDPPMLGANGGVFAEPQMCQGTPAAILVQLQYGSHREKLILERSERPEVSNLEFFVTQDIPDIKNLS
jgi:hypothetical protein